MTINKKILIYGMSNTISVIEYLTEEKPIINHHNYIDGVSEGLISLSKGITIKGEVYELYYMILNPKFINKTGGFGYYHEGQKKFIAHEAFNEEFKAEIQKIGANLITIGCLNGNEHNLMALTKNRFPGDFRDADGCYLDETREPVPYELVRNELISSSLGTIELYKHLNTLLTNSKNIIISPPPPIDLDVDYINIFNEGFREDAVAYGVNDIKIRIKIYKMYCSLLKELTEIGYKFVDVPESIYIDKGMAKEFASGVTHGNIKFAEYFFRHIEAEII